MQKIIITYRVTGTIQGVDTAWYCYGANPDDALIDVDSSIRIKRMVAIESYDPNTQITTPLV